MITQFQKLFARPRHLILLILTAWIGLVLAEKRAERHGISKDDLNNLTFYGLLAFIIGGRVVYVLQNISAFTHSPLDVFSINMDVFDITGAIATAIIASLIYGQRHNLKLWSTLDALVPFFTMLAIGGHLSQLAAGTAIGAPSNVPWAIEQRHPTQIYGFLASLLILGLLWFKKHDSHSGILFLLFAALTSLSILIIEAFRGDSTFILGGLRQSQVIALNTLVGLFILIEYRLTAPAESNVEQSSKSVE
ncbi:MAG: prolipoprotein diacylglyceryl transferase family protein [Anaerolineales bacterium]